MRTIAVEVPDDDCGRCKLFFKGRCYYYDLSLGINKIGLYERSHGTVVKIAPLQECKDAEIKDTRAYPKRLTVEDIMQATTLDEEELDGVDMSAEFHYVDFKKTADNLNKRIFGGE